MVTLQTCMGILPCYGAAQRCLGAMRQLLWRIKERYFRGNGLLLLWWRAHDYFLCERRIANDAVRLYICDKRHFWHIAEQTRRKLKGNAQCLQYAENQTIEYYSKRTQQAIKSMIE